MRPFYICCIYAHQRVRRTSKTGGPVPRLQTSILSNQMSFHRGLLHSTILLFSSLSLSLSPYYVNAAAGKTGHPKVQV